VSYLHEQITATHENLHLYTVHDYETLVLRATKNVKID